VVGVAPGRNTQTERRRLQIGPVSVAYQVAGAGEPIVLIHGLSGSGRWWSRNIPALAARFQVHVLDLIGFGGSRGRQAFVLAEAAAYVLAWMDHLELHRASLVGHSMGGFIAADLAAGFPERVCRLVLVDAAALPFDSSHLRRPRGLVQAMRGLPLTFWPVLATDALRAGPITIARAARELLRTDLTSRLTHITTPTLIVWGRHDTIVPPTVGEQLSRSLPDARLALIDNAGHNPMWDQPDVFNHVVTDFLAGDQGSRLDRLGSAADD